MKNAAEPAYQPQDEDQGVADSAASLGADGGPSGQKADQHSIHYDDSLDELDDDSWLEGELSDEELAALGEEDFDEADLEGLDLSDEGFSEEELLGADIDAALEEEHAALSEGNAVKQDGSATSEAGGALVAAGSTSAVEAYDEDISDLEEEIDHRPVPRISIHAFCETPSVTALLEKAAVDRRLSKAHLTIHMGGLAKAVDQFQTAATPNLIILETAAKGSEIFAQLGELAEVCDPSTKVVIIGQANDIILYRELIRQGISEYIVQPRSPLQIIKAIADLYVDPSAPPIGRTIAFVGARGGVGSSTIAHNVGWCSAEEYQSDTVILDLDLPFGTASLDFDQEASAGLFEALSSPERLDDVLLDRLLQKHTEHLSLFTAPSALDRDYDVDDQAYETVLDVVRSSAPTVIVDVPHMWTSWAKRILTTADEIVITATPDLASFRNTKQLVDILSVARPNDAPPTLVINQFDSKLSVVQPSQFVEHVGLEPVEVFNWDPQIFGTAMTNAAPIVEMSPKSKTANAFRELSAKLIGRAEAVVAKPKFSLAGLFAKKR